jgi:polyhydroxyalkanoate synthesis regulator protein
MTSAMGKTPMDMIGMTPMKALEEQARRNIELFQNAMRMFTPFPNTPEEGDGDESEKPSATRGDDLQDLKEQIAAMQRKLDQMGQ